MKKSIFLVLCCVYTGAIGAPLACTETPAVWTINAPFFQEKEEPKDLSKQKNHAWGTTKHYMDVAIDIHYRMEQGCYIPQITLHTRDYIDIAYKKEVLHNVCLRNYILQHERKHASYAKVARHQLLPRLQQKMLLMGQNYKPSDSNVRMLKEDILRRIPSVLAELSGSLNAQLDSQEAITPERRQMCQWKE